MLILSKEPPTIKKKNPPQNSNKNPANPGEEVESDFQSYHVIRLISSVQQQQKKSQDVHRNESVPQRKTVIETVPETT